MRSARADRRRSEYLTQRGYQVLRFWNREVTSNTEGVLEAILAAVSANLAQ